MQLGSPPPLDISGADWITDVDVFAYEAARTLPAFNDTQERLLATHPLWQVRMAWACRNIASKEMLAERLIAECHAGVLATIVAHPALSYDEIRATPFHRRGAERCAAALRPDAAIDDAIADISSVPGDFWETVLISIQMQIVHRQWMRIHPAVLRHAICVVHPDAAIPDGNRWVAHRWIQRNYPQYVTNGRLARASSSLNSHDLWWGDVDGRLYWWAEHPARFVPGHQLGRQAAPLYGSPAGDMLARLIVASDIIPAKLLQICAGMFPDDTQLAALHDEVTALPVTERVAPTKRLTFDIF